MLLRRRAAANAPRRRDGGRTRSGVVRLHQDHGDGAATTTNKKKRAAGRAPLVLVVDDVDDNRDLYATYLAYAGFRVDQATDGEDALAKVAAVKPDIIIMDLAMPRMDGWEATRLIKTNPRTRDIVVLVVTGHATPDDLERAKAMGADALCTKPCLPADLLAHVQSLLER